MTLRFEGNRPVGLDWPSITTEHNPEVWKQASLVQRQRQNPSEPSEVGNSPTGKRISPAVERRICTLYRDQQLSAKEAAALVGVQPATVFKVLHRNGIPSRSKAEGMRLSRTNQRRQETRTPDGKFL